VFNCYICQKTQSSAICHTSFLQMRSCACGSATSVTASGFENTMLHSYVMHLQQVTQVSCHVALHYISCCNWFNFLLLLKKLFATPFSDDFDNYPLQHLFFCNTTFSIPLQVYLPIASPCNNACCSCKVAVHLVQYATISVDGCCIEP
jgi:hypothetical protein